MTRKDYELVATVIGDFAEGATVHDHDLLAAVAHQLAARFAEDNPRFEYERFLLACLTD